MEKYNCQSRLWSQIGTKVNGSHHGTTRYSDQQGSKSRQKVMRLSLVATSKTNCTLVLHRAYKVWWLCLKQTACTLVLHRAYKVCWLCQKQPSDWSALYATTASDLPALCRFSTGAYNTRHSTSNGTDQYQNGSSNLLTLYREQPRSTRNVVAYSRPAFSAKNRKNYAPTSFDQQVQDSQGHTLYRNKKN